MNGDHHANATTTATATGRHKAESHSSADPDEALLRLAAFDDWYSQNGRKYPWRNTTDPWLLVLAEMLLRRTRADQVAQMYASVIGAFPDPHSMAVADIADIQKILAPAGLNSRAGELQALARSVVEDFGGVVPTTEDELLTFRGVGPYVAGAVSAAATGKNCLLIDTNTVRVALRVAGVTVEARDIRRQKEVLAAVERLLGGPAAERSWWAVIDLAANLCKPREPNCESCPIRRNCTHGTLKLIGPPSG